MLAESIDVAIRPNPLALGVASHEVSDSYGGAGDPRNILSRDPHGPAEGKPSTSPARIASRWKRGAGSPRESSPGAARGGGLTYPAGKSIVYVYTDPNWLIPRRPDFL